MLLHAPRKQQSALQLSNRFMHGMEVLFISGVDILPQKRWLIPPQQAMYTLGGSGGIVVKLGTAVPGCSPPRSGIGSTLPHRRLSNLSSFPSLLTTANEGHCGNKILQEASISTKSATAGGAPLRQRSCERPDHNLTTKTDPNSDRITALEYVCLISVITVFAEVTVEALLSVSDIENYNTLFTLST